MKKVLLLALALVVLVAGCHIWIRVNAQHAKLIYKGQMVHPFAIGQLLGYLEHIPDLAAPKVVAIDIHASYPKAEMDGVYVRAEFEKKEGGGKEYIGVGYAYLGQMANGVYVVNTYWNGGGSGSFHDLVFLRFSETNKGVLMSVVKKFELGDRYNGNIKLFSDYVFVGASRYRWGNGQVVKDVEVRLP